MTAMFCSSFRSTKFSTPLNIPVDSLLYFHVILTMSWTKFTRKPSLLLRIDADIEKDEGTFSLRNIRRVPNLG